MPCASYITAAPTSPCCDWLMTQQCSQTAAETQTTMFLPQSRKTQGSGQSIQIPAAFRGALNASQWEEREILKYLYLQVIIYRNSVNYAQVPNQIYNLCRHLPGHKMLLNPQINPYTILSERRVPVGCSGSEGS